MEQLRLEALRLANTGGATPEEILERAKAYHSFLIGSDSRASALPAEHTALTPPPSTVSAKEDKFVVYHPDGSRRAGYMHSKDALVVYTDELKSVTNKEELNGYQQHNVPGMSKLSKEHIAKLQMAISEKVAELQKAAAAPETPDPVVEPPTTAGSTDADLAALFASGNKIEAVAAENAIDKETFVKAMVAFARKVGAPESGAWLTKAGYTQILDVPPDAYRKLMADADARLAELTEK